MPKVIVLIVGAEPLSVTLAEAAAEGAARVRFTEIDVERVAHHQASSRARHEFSSATRILDYDGVILACPAATETAMELSQLLEGMEREAADAFTHTVFGVAAADGETAALGRVAQLGGLIVAAPRGVDDPEARARALGTRVATVVGWVRHALSHDHH